MERQRRTSEGLRGLVQDLEQKLDGSAAPLAEREPVIILDGTSAPYNGLVSDLDKKLQERHHREPEIIPPRFGERVPTWLGFLLVTLLGIGLAVLVVRPWQPQCTYSSELCQIARLDIDALRVTIPDSELFATLPSIDELDPDDELTAGDIFTMERFADLDFAELITDEEIARVLGTTD